MFTVKNAIFKLNYKDYKSSRKLFNTKKSHRTPVWRHKFCVIFAEFNPLILGLQVCLGMCNLSRPAIICSKLTTETLEQIVKYVQS